jgi:hypothetical protein
MNIHLFLLLFTVAFQITNIISSYTEVLPWVCLVFWVAFVAKGLQKLSILGAWLRAISTDNHRVILC